MITLLSITMLGFVLGMRHAIDPDHVVAVTTIVSRERTVFHAAAIGALWGVGHTFTILLVGSAIILFRIHIPPRLGLSMELSVGFMLILLGVLNLTGALRHAMEWASSRWPGSGAHSHFIMGRQVVHAHDEECELISNDSFSLPGWTVIPDEIPIGGLSEQVEPTLSLRGLKVADAPKPALWRRRVEPALFPGGLQVEPAPPNGSAAGRIDCGSI